MLREEEQEFVQSFYAATDERIETELLRGAIGPLTAEFSRSLDILYRSRQQDSIFADRWRREMTEIKTKEARQFNTVSGLDFHKQSDFTRYFKNYARSLGFRLVRTNISELSSVMALPLRNEVSLFVKLNTVSFWGVQGDTGAINTSSGVIGLRNGQSYVPVNIDSMLPALGIYRIFSNWAECALGGIAIVYAHKCFANALSNY